MLYIDNPEILLETDQFFPSNTNGFHENMNIMARSIIIFFTVMAVWTKNYKIYVNQGASVLIILTIFIYVCENSSEGLSPTRITQQETTKEVPAVHQSASFENGRGRQFFKTSNPFQGPRPTIKKKKVLRYHSF